MPRTVEHEPLQKHTLFLYKGDFDKLASFYIEAGGASVVIRHLIRAHIDKVERGVSPLTLNVGTEL